MEMEFAESGDGELVRSTRGRNAEGKAPFSVPKARETDKLLLFVFCARAISRGIESGVRFPPPLPVRLGAELLRGRSFPRLLPPELVAGRVRKLMQGAQASPAPKLAAGKRKRRTLRS